VADKRSLASETQEVDRKRLKGKRRRQIKMNKTFKGLGSGDSFGEKMN
jgi:hypothetical protein